MSTTKVTRRERILALIAALLGWMFDGMEMGLFPLVGKDALCDLLGEYSIEQVNNLYGVIIACFLVGAATGGVLFGWIGDKVGRVKAMTLSILVYSLCSGLSAFSTSVEQLAILRFIGALGMGGEWALGVALVMELWPDTSRVWLAGTIGAFGNLGYTICGIVALILNSIDKNDTLIYLTTLGINQTWATKLVTYNYWRLIFLAGAIPAFLTVFIRLAVPESTKWLISKNTFIHNPISTRTSIIYILMGGIAGCALVYVWYLPDNTINIYYKLTITPIILVIIVLSYLRPVLKYDPETRAKEQTNKDILIRMLIGAGLSGVPLLGTWAGLMWAYMWVNDLPNGQNPYTKPYMQIISSVGATIGCVSGAILAEKIGRKLSYVILCMLTILIMLVFYRCNTNFDYFFLLSMGSFGFVSASFYGWLPLYLPELFPTKIRTTGQGFSFNFGRIIAAIGNLQMSKLLAAFDNNYINAGSLITIVYIAGIILVITIAPETKGKSLPD
ncbi:MAG: MFS transporter [Candidatus Bilamarchaeaceae archaeon]